MCYAQNSSLLFEKRKIPVVALCNKVSRRILVIKIRLARTAELSGYSWPAVNIFSEKK
jgi:hypothetical protein